MLKAVKECGTRRLTDSELENLPDDISRIFIDLIPGRRQANEYW